MVSSGDDGMMHGRPRRGNGFGGGRCDADDLHLGGGAIGCPRGPDGCNNLSVLLGETMPLNRRHLAVAGASLLSVAALGAASGSAASKGDDAGVAAAVEAFRKAMLANDRKQFEALCADQLTYGHSTGKVQTKAEFIDDASSGKSNWKSITLEDQTIVLAGGNAMARFVFTGDLDSGGKTSTLKFGVLMVWVRQSGKWRLLARQGYKI
jgi:hypothetical protein